MHCTVWKGTQQECLELLAVIGDNCTCTADRRGMLTTSCPAHRMLLREQRALDGLLFARRALRDRLYVEEWIRTGCASTLSSPADRGSVQ